DQLGGVTMVHHPNRSSAAALQGLISGRTKLLFDTASAVAPALRARRMDALLTTGPNRCPAVPQLRTAQEQGLRNFAITAWIGLFAPRKTPAVVIAKLNTALNAAMA